MSVLHSSARPNCQCQWCMSRYNHGGDSELASKNTPNQITHCHKLQTRRAASPPATVHIAMCLRVLRDALVSQARSRATAKERVMVRATAIIGLQPIKTRAE